jgi:hypothetical protein
VWEPVEPLTDETADAVFWAPQEFKVGDRVRVRMTGECRFHHMGNAHLTADYTLIDALRDGTLGGPGFMGANGAIGTIQAVSQSDDDEGHPYLVSDAQSGRWDRVDDFFAASELEPVP